MRVLIAIRKDILNRVVIENQTDLISHLYCICLDIKKVDPQSGKRPRKTSVVNPYDNKIGKGQPWE